MDKIDRTVKRHKDGAIINLFVTPDAKSINFPAGYNKWRNCIEMKICSPAKEDKANMEVIKTVAEFVESPIENVYIISGRKNRSKTVLIKGVSPDNVSERLKESLNGL
jgi:uncharacterized protein (TIGR00251 family)